MRDLTQGPLAGLKVVELASEAAALCGKLFGDLGAEVVLVEPRAGHVTRRYEPFVADQPGAESSLWYWHYNTSKLGVALDLGDPADAAAWRRLVDGADVVIEGETPGTLERLGLGAEQMTSDRPNLVWVSVTPFGRTGSRASAPATDLTVLSAGGMVWSCGYDDHDVPPVRGGGNQGLHLGSVWGAIGALVALVARDGAGAGRGQIVDASMTAAANVTTEFATQYWLVAEEQVERQTGRHAAPLPTQRSVVPALDGREAHTGLPPRSESDFRIVRAWLDELGLSEAFGDTVLLDLAIEQGGIDLDRLSRDPLSQQYFGAARDALVFIASHLPAHAFFLEGQRRGLQVGVVNSPEEAMTDPHLVARGFPTPVWDERIGRVVLHAGAPYRFTRTPWRIAAPAPRLGQHQSLVE